MGMSYWEEAGAYPSCHIIIEPRGRVHKPVMEPTEKFTNHNYGQFRIPI